jgi:putative transposase
MDPCLSDEIRTATNGNYALGNKRFTAEVSSQLQQPVTPDKPGRPARSD